MNLHLDSDNFEELIELTSSFINVPTLAIRKDYFITLLLKNLSESEYKEEVIFKGGTSLSKCYPNSINRFSEDIDLTLIPNGKLSNNAISKKLRKIEKAIIGNGERCIIPEERSPRNKSCNVWFNNDFKEQEIVKLEIGSTVRSSPVSKRTLCSYIHQYLISIDRVDVIQEYKLEEVELLVLNIERTFIDKILAIKRHAICGTLTNKVRHIYDVVRLYERKEIKAFFDDLEHLKEIVKKTKDTDFEYLDKRRVSNDYNPLESYNFNQWRRHLDSPIKKRYEKLHEDLLHTDEMQNFDDAMTVLEEINLVLNEIGE